MGPNKAHRLSTEAKVLAKDMARVCSWGADGAFCLDPYPEREGKGGKGETDRGTDGRRQTEREADRTSFLEAALPTALTPKGRVHIEI